MPYPLNIGFDAGGASSISQVILAYYTDLECATEPKYTSTTFDVETCYEASVYSDTS
jgi:hypothetical protein